VSKTSEVRRFEALVIPNDALERGGVEVLRAAIIDSELHVTLRPTFEEPHHWGELLSEVVERIARSYAEQTKLKQPSSPTIRLPLLRRRCRPRNLVRKPARRLRKKRAR
jgi:hypothetical protein